MHVGILRPQNGLRMTGRECMDRWESFSLLAAVCPTLRKEREGWGTRFYLVPKFLLSFGIPG